MKIVFALLALGLLACSDDNPDNRLPVTILDDDMSQSDQGEADMNDMVNLPDQFVENCVEDGCVPGLICNENTGQCVNCETNVECGENGFCNPEKLCECDAEYHACDGVCVNSFSPETCGGSCDACPVPENGTATCDGVTCGIACEAPLVAVNGECVGCETNAECTSPSASFCDAGSCAPCSNSADCSHIASAPICAEGTCVECTQSTDCGGNVCAGGVCTNIAAGSVNPCQACTASEACTEGHACVAMEFDGATRTESFCLPIKGADECPSPWVFEAQKLSVEGATVTACGPNEAVTTCEAVLDAGESCVNADECGVQGLADGRCEPTTFENTLRCTYDCTSSNQCREIGDFEFDEIGCISGDYCGGI